MYRPFLHHEKTPLLDIALSRLIVSLGHGDIVVIGDAGSFVPASVELIDLALTKGVPDFVRCAMHPCVQRLQHLYGV